MQVRFCLRFGYSLRVNVTRFSTRIVNSVYTYILIVIKRLKGVKKNDRIRGWRVSTRLNKPDRLFLLFTGCLYLKFLDWTSRNRYRCLECYFWYTWAAIRKLDAISLFAPVLEYCFLELHVMQLSNKMIAFYSQNIPQALTTRWKYVVKNGVSIREVNGQLSRVLQENLEKEEIRHYLTDISEQRLHVVS